MKVISDRTLLLCTVTGYFAAVVFSVATVAVSASGVLLSFYCVSELAELSSGH